MAFVAGTGVLVLLDLVSHLLILNSFEAQSKGLPDEMKFFDSDFKLHLFVAFRSRDHAIGLDILEALLAINKKLGKDNFKLTLRLSEVPAGEQKLPRWTPEYIEE